jgi:GNAT superfamily N-acetyltransferase
LNKRLKAAIFMCVVIPKPVQLAALFPDTDLPPPPPDHPFKQVRRDGYTIGLQTGMTFANVVPRRIDADGVGQAVADVRGLAGERGMTRAAWFVSEQARPEGLAADLLSMGMVPHDDPPHEPRYTSMLLLEEPDLGPLDVEARPAETFAEFQAGLRIGNEAFEMSSEDRAGMVAHELEMWGFEQSWGVFRTFVALVGGEVVGKGASIQGTNAAFLVGGSTRADMRGRGVYRALVRARWDHAVVRGTQSLTVSAGRMSRPILERLGFVNVGWGDCLLDQFG